MLPQREERRNYTKGRRNHESEMEIKDVEYEKELKHVQKRNK